MKIADDMVEIAGAAHVGNGMRTAIEAVAPLIRASALEEAAQVAETYKNTADMRAAMHKRERNSAAQNAALDKFEAALEIETAIRALKDKPHE